MYGCKSWTITKAECQRSDAFELWFWRRLLRVPWTARRSNQPILKKINREYSLEGLMLKLQYFGQTWCDKPTHWKRPWCWERLKAGGDGDKRGQDGWVASPTWWTGLWANSRSWWRTGEPGMLRPWGCKELDTTEWTPTQSRTLPDQLTCTRFHPLWGKTSSDFLTWSSVLTALTDAIVLHLISWSYN